MALVVVTFSSSSISFAFEQPVREPCSAVDDRSVREAAPATGRGRDAQQQRCGSDGEISAVVYARTRREVTVSAFAPDVLTGERQRTISEPLWSTSR